MADDRRPNPDELAMLRRTQRNRRHFDDTVRARVYPTIPEIPLPTDMVDDEEAAFLGLDGIATDTEKVRDYENYRGVGFNPDVFQAILFTDKIERPNARPFTKRTWRHLGPATGQTSEGHLTGDVFGTKSDDNGRTVRNDEPSGSWVLVPPVGECTLERGKRHYYAECAGQRVEVEYRKTCFDGRSRWVYLQDMPEELGGGNNAVFGQERIPVESELEILEEDGKIAKVGDRHFGYRNYLGTLQFVDNGGGVVQEFHLVNVEEKGILKNREAYAKQVVAWAKLTPEARAQARRARTGQDWLKRPRGIFESYLVKTANMPKSDFFIEVKDDGEGGFQQLKRPQRD